MTIGLFIAACAAMVAVARIGHPTKRIPDCIKLTIQVGLIAAMTSGAVYLAFDTSRYLAEKLYGFFIEE